MWRRSRADGRQEVEFELFPSSIIKIHVGDITRWSVDGSSDAIVNPANQRMLGDGGGADGAIHQAAGPQLREVCYDVRQVKPGVRCPTGEARITPGFRLPASHVIHTVGPIYGVDKNPEASLRNAYRNSLRVANEHNIQYIAFTAISCGVYGYPFDEAATVAISTIKEYAGNIKEVHFALSSDDIYNVWLKKARELSPSSVLKIQIGDITRWSVDGSSDAIVNPANQRMLGGGGADGAIHQAAGPQLRAACYDIPEIRPGVRCPTGGARITPGFQLPASRVIHTVGPIYDVDKNPEASLRNAYRKSLSVAKEHNIQYIAFPAISCGIYGYPFDEAASVAISTIKEYAGDMKEVHFVLFSDDIYDVWLKKARELLQK